jgi:hypothetical protein
VCNANLQNSLAYGGDVCDTTGTSTTTTNGLLPPPLFAPTNTTSQMCAPPQDTFFIGDDDFSATAGSRHHRASFFGADMGCVSEHELKWDDFSSIATTTTNTLSTTTDLLCRQASHGVDDLAAFFFSDENRVVF